MEHEKMKIEIKRSSTSLSFASPPPTVCNHRSSIYSLVLFLCHRNPSPFLHTHLITSFNSPLHNRCIGP